MTTEKQQELLLPPRFERRNFSHGKLAGSQGASGGNASLSQTDTTNNAGDEGVHGWLRPLIPTKMLPLSILLTRLPKSQASSQSFLRRQLPTLISPSPNCTLPANITSSSILDRVRGGAILSGQLLNTLPITSHDTERVISLHEFSTLAFEDYAQKYPIKLPRNPPLPALCWACRSYMASRDYRG